MAQLRYNVEALLKHGWDIDNREQLDDLLKKQPRALFAEKPALVGDTRRKQKHVAHDCSHTNAF